MSLMKKSALAIAASAAVLGAGMAGAEVSSGKAAALGSSLTPMGSEKAGNAAGTIPDWSGGIFNLIRDRDFAAFSVRYSF